METFQFYASVILNERQWTWSLTAIIYLIVTLLVRSSVFDNLVVGTRRIDPQIYSAVKTFYYKRSAGGWIALAISFILVSGGWAFIPSPLQNQLEIVCLVFLLAVFFFFLSLILHLSAYSHALLGVLRQRTEIEKEF